METSNEERMDQLMSSYLHQQSNSVSNSEETDEGGVGDDVEEEGLEGNEREKIFEEDNDEGQEDEERNLLEEMINGYDEGEEDGEGTLWEEKTEYNDVEEEDDEGNPRDEIMEDDDEEGEIQEQEQIPTRHQYSELQTCYDQSTVILQMSPSSPSRSTVTANNLRLHLLRIFHHMAHIIKILNTTLILLCAYPLMWNLQMICEHKKQLYQEMLELRKSINRCLDMQVKLQGSFNQDSNSAQAKGKRSVDAGLRRGICCICYEAQVNSLLYRCGHMCTRLKCAHELQWGSRKCPICRAPIADVVRAFTDS